MTFPNIFTQSVADTLIARINKLTPETQPQWGKMNVAQMLAHCCVSYEMAFENKHAKPGAVARFFLKAFVKPIVCTDKPYKQNSQTAPAFLITDQRIFETEKAKLIAFLNKSVQAGESYFKGKKSNSFGVLTIDEWNTMFYKHIDHHLNQFGV